MIKRITTITFIFLLGFFHTISAQNGDSFFPTGMIWKEVTAEPEDLPLDTTICPTIYEIGPDTIINERLYKQVCKDGEMIKTWVREDSGQIWLLTDVYARELLLYNFNWIPDSLLYTEYIKETDSGMEPFRVEFSVNDYKTTTIGDQNIQYIEDWCGCIIRGIGRVADLNRNCCLLGYRIPDDVVPGVIFRKVLWIRKNNIEIFRSENAEEWTTTIPTSTQVVTLFEANHSYFDIYHLDGSKLQQTPQKGVYIQNGKKVAVK